MNHLTDQLLVLAMLCNFIPLGSGRVRVAIRATAVQGVVLAILPVLVAPFHWRVAALSAAILAAKGIVIPRLLLGAAARIEGGDEKVAPFVGYSAALFLGGVTTALAFLFTARLPLAAGHQGLLVVPAAIATIGTGFLVLTTRKKAITQVTGYLLLENGIFIFGLLLTEAMPMMVEAGILLDLLVGIFVMGIIISHIGTEFSSIDTSRLTSLRE